MKRGFTLVELLLVMGLMALMGAMAIGGYAAITRGMSDRAAIDAAKTVAEAAQQRANIDQAKTYLYLFNEVDKIDSDMSPGVVSGVIIAVRPVGRISAVPEGGFYVDEFGDLDETYRALDDESKEMTESEKEESAVPIRLYSIPQRTYASVLEGVEKANGLVDGDLEDGSTIDVTDAMYGFRKVDGDAEFKPGDQYGQEFAVMRLPPNYTFSQNVTMKSVNDLGQTKVDVIEVNPGDASAPSVQVFVRRPNGVFESIGSTSQTKDGKQ